MKFSNNKINYPYYYFLTFYVYRYFIGFWVRYYNIIFHYESINVFFLIVFFFIYFFEAGKEERRSGEKIGARPVTGDSCAMTRISFSLYDFILFNNLQAPRARIYVQQFNSHLPQNKTWNYLLYEGRKKFFFLILNHVI